MLASSRISSAGSVLVCTLFAWATLVSSAVAHHSFTAVYDTNSYKEIEGRLTTVRWINPHVKISVTTRDGLAWDIEAGPVNLLSRMKIDQSLLKVGETIRVRGNPSRSNPRGLWVSNIRLPDGTELLVAPGARPVWDPPKPPTGNPGDVFDGEVTRGDSVFRIWSTQIASFPKPRGAPVLTDAGRRAQTRYKVGGPPIIGDCEVPGMPFAMMSPYPMEIVQQGDRLLIRGEAYDLKRTVFLKAPRTPPAPSPLGMSVGRIVDRQLIVETTRINYHSYGDLGPAQSNQSHVVERFTLSRDGTRLDYDITVTDPVMLREPWSWGGTFWSRKGVELKIWTRPEQCR